MNLTPKMLLAFLLLPLLAVAQPEADRTTPGAGEVFPRAASLKRGEVNVRSGPGTQYPILWIYWRAGYPVAVIARFDNYLKIRDLEGEEGWVHQAMVGKRVTGLVVGSGGGREATRLYYKADTESRTVAKLAAGVLVAQAAPCGPLFCEVEVLPSGETGYARPTDIEWPVE